MNDTPRKIAEEVRKAGGRAYFVGGYVRDKLLGRESKDIDIEVHGLSSDTLFSILTKVGRPLSFGSNFGIYSLRDEHIDIALPRKEHATGRGHRDFEVYVDPFIGEESAARRRDFTINAMMEDILTGEVLDFFNGKQDLLDKVLKHVDENSFAEDPLRVFRGAQFASRFDLAISKETMDLCSGIETTSLSKERVEEELKKALLTSFKPSIFFRSLKEMGKLSPWFSEIEKLEFLEQDPIFHPEGNVFNHTMDVIDRAAEYRKDASNPYAFMLLCLTHDFGKIVSTEVIDGKIHAYGHEVLGLPLIEEFLHRITNEKEVKSYVLNMAALHMKPNLASYNKSQIKTTNRMFDDSKSPKDLILFSMCDKPVFSGEDPFTGDSAFLYERLRIYEELMSRPYVTGKDLIEAGLSPGDYFSSALEYAHKLRLAGIDKKEALKQTISYARKGIKNEKRKEEFK